MVAGKYTRSLTGEAQLSLLAKACNNLPQTPPRNLQLPSPTPSTLHIFFFLSLSSPSLFSRTSSLPCLSIMSEFIGSVGTRSALVAKELQLTEMNYRSRISLISKSDIRSVLTFCLLPLISVLTANSDMLALFMKSTRRIRPSHSKT